MELPLAEMAKIVGGAGLRDNQVTGHINFEMPLSLQSRDMEKEGKLAEGGCVYPVHSWNVQPRRDGIAS